MMRNMFKILLYMVVTYLVLMTGIFTGDHIAEWLLSWLNGTLLFFILAILFIWLNSSKNTYYVRVFLNPFIIGIVFGLLLFAQTVTPDYVVMTIYTIIGIAVVTVYILALSIASKKMVVMFILSIVIISIFLYGLITSDFDGQGFLLYVIFASSIPVYYILILFALYKSDRTPLEAVATVNLYILLFISPVTFNATGSLPFILPTPNIEITETLKKDDDEE